MQEWPPASVSLEVIRQPWTPNRSSIQQSSKRTSASAVAQPVLAVWLKPSGTLTWNGGEEGGGFCLPERYCLPGGSSLGKWTMYVGLLWALWSRWRQTHSLTWELTKLSLSLFRRVKGREGQSWCFEKSALKQSTSENDASVHPADPYRCISHYQHKQTSTANWGQIWVWPSKSGFTAHVWG